MTPYYSDSHVTIWHGDCRDVLPGLDPVAQENLRKWYRADYGLIAVCEELFGS